MLRSYLHWIYSSCLLAMTQIMGSFILYFIKKYTCYIFKEGIFECSKFKHTFREFLYVLQAITIQFMNVKKIFKDLFNFSFTLRLEFGIWRKALARQGFDHVRIRGAIIHPSLVGAGAIGRGWSVANHR